MFEQCYGQKGLNHAWGVLLHLYADPDSNVHGINMGPTWGQQDPGGPHVSPMNFAIRGVGLSLVWECPECDCPRCLILLWNTVITYLTSANTHFFKFSLCLTSFVFLSSSIMTLVVSGESLHLIPCWCPSQTHLSYHGGVQKRVWALKCKSS